MMFRTQRATDYQRMTWLAHADTRDASIKEATACRDEGSTSSQSQLSLLLLQADVDKSPYEFISSLILVASVCAGFSIRLFSLLGALVVFLLVLYMGIAWLRRLAARRAHRFLEDYPSVVLATAASLKAGLSPYAALERAVQFFPRENLVRREADLLLEKLRSGVSKERALAEFAASIDQPDLVLFRQGLLLVLENGGRFSPTLQRLARVSRDRAVLVQSARVSTATMRTTAHILLCLTPALVGMVALRTNEYWTTLFHHPTARILALSGSLLILVSYLTLRRMSAFTP